jgi:HEAT repeat protein
MLAIQLLGDLRSKSAIPALKSILQKEDDFYVIREIVQALRKIEGTESEAILSALREHKSKLVRDLVVEKS